MEAHSFFVEALHGALLLYHVLQAFCCGAIRPTYPLYKIKKGYIVKTEGRGGGSREMDKRRGNALELYQRVGVGSRSLPGKASASERKKASASERKKPLLKTRWLVKDV